MQVFVLNQRGEPLMPCSPRKARLLLKSQRARIVGRKPFTIQLCQDSANFTQETHLGIDTGAKYIGVAVTSQNNVLIKGQIELRQDVRSLLETRKTYRRARRGKLCYREPRFLNRKKPIGWLPPSIQSRVNNIINWINKFHGLLPKCKLHIEVCKFDIQKLENPNIKGVEYQRGTLYEYRNHISYLIARENNKCQYCHKSYVKGDPWRLHHIWGKDRDRPADWALLHESCHIHLHQNHEEGLLRKRRSKSYKESTFMNIARKRLFDAFPEANFTYGNVTFQDRIDLGLEKTHYNDAVAVAMGSRYSIDHNPDSVFIIKQFRKKKRSLHEATARKGRAEHNKTCKRNAKNTKAVSFIGKKDSLAKEESLFYYKNTKYVVTKNELLLDKKFHLNDKVHVLGKIGFISGFDKDGCYVRDILGNYIMLVGKAYKQVRFTNVRVMEHNNNWQCIPYLEEISFC